MEVPIADDMGSLLTCTPFLKSPSPNANRNMMHFRYIEEEPLVLQGEMGGSVSQVTVKEQNVKVTEGTQNCSLESCMLRILGGFVGAPSLAIERLKWKSSCQSKLLALPVLDLLC